MVNHLTTGQSFDHWSNEQVLGGLLLGDARSLAERVSEGRSGSLFYYSHDNRF